MGALVQFWLKIRRRGHRTAGVATLVLLLIGAYPVWLLWTDNFHAVAPGEFYRSGQMDRRELATAVRRYEFRAVLNLRGPNPGEAWYNDEVGVCQDLGLKHADFKLSARRDVAPEQVRQLEELLRCLPKPFLVHCNGGGDRSGFAAALYQLHLRGRPPAEARRQLSWRYGHVPCLWWSASSAMDRSFARLLEPDSLLTNAGANRRMAND